MEQISQAENNQSDTAFEKIESQIRECYGRAAWTHKTHEKCADLDFKSAHRIKIAQIILTSITTVGFVGLVFGGDLNNLCVKIIGAILSGTSLVLNLYTKDYNLLEKASKHSNTAIQLWNIRESYLSLLTDIQSRSITIDDLKIKRDELQQRLSEVYNIAPRTNDEAYKSVNTSLKKNQELTFSDEEIDQLLPKKLRKTAQI